MAKIFELGRRCAFFSEGDHSFRLRVGSDGYCWIARLGDRGQVLHSTEMQPTIGGTGTGATLLASSSMNLDDPKNYAKLLRKIGHRQVAVDLEASPA